MILLLWACTPKPAELPEPLPEPAPPGALTILHTNDLHGHYLPEPADWLDNRPSIGGMVRLDAEVDALRRDRRDAVLLLDGGDILTGTPLTDLVVDGAKGGAMLQFLDGIGYDAWALGNHEFDKGLDNLIALTSATRVPVLSSNVLTPEGEPLLPHQKRSEIFEANGLQIGVIGATTEGLQGLMSRQDFSRLKLRSVADSVREEVERLDPDTDLIVVLSHIGVEDDRALAAQVDGIDLIVGGHSHTRLTTAEQVNGTWIVQAGSYTRSLGVVDLKVEGDAITEFSYELRDLLPGTAPGPASPEVQALADRYEAEISKVYNAEISTAPAVLGRSYNHESALGRWITDVLRETTGADIGLYNGGGLRADIAAGPVRVLDIYQCFPFGNKIVTFQFTGDEVMRIVNGNMAAEAYEKRGFLSMSGLSYTWRLVNGAPEASEVKVGGQPLDPAKTYTLTTNTYVAEQWEKHFGVQPRNLQILELTDFDAAVAWARKHPVADPGDLRARRTE
jgi:5'-nucleotidase / UDP-sugar diphosphatase